MKVIILIFISIALLLGCYAIPESVSKSDISSTSASQLPLQKDLLIHLSREQRNKVKTFTITDAAGRQRSWPMYEGQAMETAAVKVLQTIFKECKHICRDS